MNTIKHVVTEVLTEPQYHEWEFEQDRQQGDVQGPPEIVSCWTIEVKANSYGRIGEHTLTFDTREEALEVEPGYEFTA